MRPIFKKLLAILDGTPAEYGRKPRLGQSVVEMAFITPLIIILIVGVVEIGWFANNYLILLEVTRVGARRGAVLTGDNSPLVWDDRATLNYRYDEAYDPYKVHPGYPLDITNPGIADDAIWPPTGRDAYTQAQWAQVEDLREVVRNCPPPEYVGFYNLILCQMIQSMDPIQIKFTNKPEDQTDDIIISVFSIQMVNNDPAGNGDYNFEDSAYIAQTNLLTTPLDPENQDEYDTGWIPVVVGRYPPSANECNMWQKISGPPSMPDIFIVGDDEPAFERDPFDFINDGLLTTRKIDWSTATGSGVVLDGAGCPVTPAGLPCYYPIELSVEVPGFGPASPGWDPPDRREVQRGFNYTGYHRVESEPVTGTDGSVAELFCYGSEWDIYEVQELMKGRGFEMSPEEILEMRARPGMEHFGQVESPPGSGIWVDIDTGEMYANQGLVLVEIHWRHHLLLDIPVFSPVYNALGAERTTIYVWSAFPAPAAVPDIDFSRPWQSFYAG